MVPPDLVGERIIATSDACYPRSRYLRSAGPAVARNAGPAATCDRSPGTRSPRPGRHTRTTAAAPRRRSRPRCAPAPRPATEPHSATPILTPTWRLVDVTADAAPARSSGIPLTAALVIGRVDHREADSEDREHDSSPHTGVVAVRKVSSTDAHGDQHARPPAATAGPRSGRPAGPTAARTAARQRRSAGRSARSASPRSRARPAGTATS